MLDHEYQLLLERLGAEPDSHRRLFAFANTVSARNYKGTNECHGWMGIRFQCEPGGAAHDILLHLNMMENENLLQQEAVGVLGINLIYAAFHEASSAQRLLECLATDLTMERIEVDLVHLDGPTFGRADAATLGFQLVQQGLAPAVVLQGGVLVPPTEILRKCAVVMKRGLFMEATSDIAVRVACGHDCLVHEFENFDREPLAMVELSVNPAGEAATAADATYLARIRELAELECPVMLTRFAETYELTAYLRRYSQQPLRFVVGASTLAMFLLQEFYSKLAGGLVEGLGKLFADNVKIYILPMRREAFYQHLRSAGVDESFVSVDGTGVAEAATLNFKQPLGHLYHYLIDMKWVVTMPIEAPPL
jgi:hypothetical protein